MPPGCLLLPFHPSQASSLPSHTLPLLFLLTRLPPALVVHLCVPELAFPSDTTFCYPTATTLGFMHLVPLSP
ncbi:hypothetical protein C8Q78DRAFT_1060696 [Trametes maxima]|nr:hypothetical protein C8Q78DRAFT_1060696 [Trametes maxima]